MVSTDLIHSLKLSLPIADIIAKSGLKKVLAVNHPTRIKRYKK